MKLQYLCHLTVMLTGFGCALTAAAADPNTTPADIPRAAAPAHDYPTLARVEYVNQCVAAHGNKLAALYQCACAIDRIANALPYDDYVEVTTFQKNVNMPGEGGGMFRDSDEGRKLVKSFAQLENDSLRNCGMGR